MKVCFISNLYPPYIIGGAEICVKREAEYLNKLGHKVVIISSSPDATQSVEMLGDIKVYRIGLMNIYSPFSSQNRSTIIKPIYHTINLWSPSSYLFIKRILKKENPDVVHIHNFKGMSLSIFDAVKSLNLPLVFTTHDFSLICLKASLLKSSGELCAEKGKFCRFYNHIQNRLVNNKPDVVISPSQFLIDRFIEEGLFENTVKLRLPLGIELDDQKSEKRYDTINFLYVGSLTKHKGVHLLVESFKQIDNENIRLHIVGKGIEESELKMLADSDKRINFRGFMTGTELSDIYSQANVVIVPSIIYDNSPTVIYESFMAGTPVIGSKIGGIPELIEDGYNGFLFDSGDLSSLKFQICKIILNPEVLKKLEVGAYESSKKYNIYTHVNRLENIYLQIVNKYNSK